MAISPRLARIGSALLIAAILVGVAFLASSPNKPSVANADSTAELLKAYAAKDSDSDGLSDWEEALYGSDPNNPHSIDATLTDGQAVAKGIVKPKFSSEAPPADPTTPDDLSVPPPSAGSITDTFSQNLINSALSSNGALSTTDQQALSASLIEQVKSAGLAKLSSSFTEASVHTDASLTATGYAADVEAVFLSDTVPADTTDPLALMSAYAEKGDTSALAKLAVLGKTYSKIAADLSAVTVPPALAGDHLKLITSLDTLGRATSAFAAGTVDPILSLAALQVFQPAFADIGSALGDIVSAVRAEGGEPAAGAPGSLLIQMMIPK